MKTNINSKLGFGVAAMSLFMLITLTGCGDKKAPEKSDAVENGKQEQIVATAERSDTVADVLPVDSQDVAAEEPVAETPKAATLHPVYMGVWGTVGGTGFNFDMDGTTGSYIPYDMAEGKEYGARRQLKLVSYNPGTGDCVIDAFLKGKYIGRFVGIFEEEEVDSGDGETHCLQAYNGMFKSVNGDSLPFNFHFD